MLTPVIIEFVTGSIVGLGVGATLHRHNLSIMERSTAPKALAIAVGSIAIWWIAGDFLWR